MPRRFPGVPAGAPVLYSVRGDAVFARLAGDHPEIAARTIQAAERVLRHEFDLLGSGPFVPRDPDRPAGAAGYMPIDWTLDPVRNLRFRNNVPFKDWRLYEMRPGLADIKHPWELARCQHFAILTQAFRLTHRPEFASEVFAQIADFMEANPEGRGIQWTCTMDVALRAASWAMALEDLRTAGFEPRGIVGGLRGAVPPRSLHLRESRESLRGDEQPPPEQRGRSLLRALVFKDDPSARVWRDFCRSSLEKEIEVQVLQDGADYESSVPYHDW